MRKIYRSSGGSRVALFILCRVEEWKLVLVVGVIVLVRVFKFTARDAVCRIINKDEDCKRSILYKILISFGL